ncbi:MAG: GtrA family protein [Treponema sp.]|nr:GtrA family protein [Treponema sp.]
MECREVPQGNEDMFDRLMGLPLLRRLAPFYRRHKSVLLYLFFGALTFLLSVATFALFNAGLLLNEHAANVRIIAVLFAYVTNRTWVFADRAYGARGILAEIGRFVSGRIATLVLEEALLFVFITLLHLNSLAVKIVAQVAVIVANYVVSKCFVFARHGADASPVG